MVRLKGGDPFVFGRGGEEAEALAAAGLAFEIVPGISSAIAVPAYAGIPLTHRDFASSFTVFTGHEDPAKEETAVDYEALVAGKGTLVMLMGMERLASIVPELLANGADLRLPVALIRWGTTGRQQTLDRRAWIDREGGGRVSAAGDCGFWSGGRTARQTELVRASPALWPADCCDTNPETGQRL